MRSLFVSLLIILLSLVPVYAGDAGSDSIPEENSYKEKLNKNLLKKKYLWLRIAGGTIGISAVAYGGALIVNHYRDEKLLKSYFESRFLETKKIDTGGRNNFYADSTVDGAVYPSREVKVSVSQKPLLGLMIETTRYESSKPAKDSDYVMIYCGGTRQDQGDIHQPLVELVEKTGIPIETFNYPGYGNSEGKVGMDLNPEIARAFVNEYKDKKIILFGHSYGAIVAIDLATKFPEVEQIFITGAFASVFQVCLENSKWYEKPMAPFTINKKKGNSELNLKNMPKRKNNELLNIMSFNGQADKVVDYAHQQQLQAAANENIRFSSMGNYNANHSSIFRYAIPYICARVNKIVNH